MKKLVVFLAVLGVIWAAAEVSLATLAEGKIEERVAARTEGEATVVADLNSFPLATRVLLTGMVKELEVTMEDVHQLQLTFAEVSITAEGIEVDRNAILSQEVRITAIDRGTITATIDASALPPVARQALAAARIEGRTLVLGPISFELARDVLPCDPDASVGDQRVILTCTIEEVPEALLDAAQDAA